MDIDSILYKKQEKSLIQKDTDPQKYNEVAAKLCDKRKALEDGLAKETISPTNREDLALELIQLKKDLVLFGVTEIDYQAYIASHTKN
jgi:hypothetical protein